MKVGFMVMIQKQSNNRHSGRAHNHPEQKAQHVRSSTTNMLILFCDVKGIVHHEFVPPNTTENYSFYCDVLRCLRENVQKKKKTGNLAQFLQHDNAPTHTSLKTTEFVTNNNMVIVPQPSYLPDLAPCDFALFPKFKMNLKGRFETVSNIQRVSQAVIDSIKENDFHSTSEAWGE
jgi:hypothetical protein